MTSSGVTDQQPPSDASIAPAPERRYELDWLRVLAMLVLLYFHTAALFYRGELGEFYVQNDRLSHGLIGLVLFIHQWHMPLLFWLSGAASWLALSFRSPWQYVQERCQRLLVPFVFGTLVLVPPQVYYHLRSQTGYRASFLRFYPQFFNGVRPTGNFEWGHLWFLIYLFTFSLLALPLFMWLRAETRRQPLARWLETSNRILLLALPLAAIEALLRPRWLGFQNLYDDWANFCLYLTYLIYGYLLSSHPGLGAAIDKGWKTALGLGLVGMGVLLGLWQFDRLPEQGYSIAYMTYQGLRGANGWFWVLAIWGAGRRWLRVQHPVLSYASAAAYPFYLLHQTVLVAIAFYVVRWNIGIAGKFWLISTATLLGTIALYELLIRRLPVTRFLFGLKPARRGAAAPGKLPSA